MTAALTPISILIAVLERGRRIALFVVLGGIVGLLAAHLRPPRYLAETAVLATGAGGPDSRVLGLAAQFGLGDLSSSAQQGLQVTPDLLLQVGSDEALLELVLTDSVTPRAAATPVSILEWLTPKWPPDHTSPAQSARRLHEGRRALARVLSVSKLKATGSLLIAVTAEDAAVAHAIAASLVKHLDRFIVGLGRAQASQERVFVVSKIEERRALLRDAEAAVAAYVTQNRNYDVSRARMYEFEALQRVVTLHEQVLVGLERSAEEAAIREVRDTPVLVQVEPLRVPTEPLPRGRVVAGLIGASVAAFLSLVAILVGSLGTVLRGSGGAEWARLEEAWSRVLVPSRCSRP